MCRLPHRTHFSDRLLGFHIRHYKTPQTSRTGYKLLITPSKAAVHALRKQLRQEWRTLRGAPVAGVLRRLNPLIRGWANYFRTGVASRIFGQLDWWMSKRAYRYVQWRHPNKPWYWRKRRYWGRFNPQRLDTWVFGDTATGGYLLKFKWFPIERYIMVRGRASPDDPRLQPYWAQRNERGRRKLPPHQQRLARIQRGVCALCGMSLYNEEDIQIHHKKPRSAGGSNEEGNLVLVHLYCQQQIHSGKITPQNAAGELLLL